MGKELDKKRTAQDFQTLPEVCKYMTSMVPEWCETILEPTPGIGNLVRELEKRGGQIIAPEDFFKLNKQDRFDCIVMNPPFSAKYSFGVPETLNKAGMRLGYHILLQCMTMSDNIIALMPWFTISNSDVRLRTIKRYGLKSLTALPRKVFQFARIQTCIMELEKGWNGETAFKVYDLINYKEQPTLL